MTMADLVAATGVKLSDVLDSLVVLKDFGLIRLVGQAGDETIEATPSGERTAGAIR
ncbi:MAG TPA: hypothetical protein VGI81_14810 [Tepidisphaeraceae bacterium]|jgi:hypothetical protein